MKGCVPEIQRIMSLCQFFVLMMWWLSVSCISWEFSGLCIEFRRVILGPSHGSFQMLICVLLTIFHTNPSWHNFHHTCIFSHVRNVVDILGLFLYLFNSRDAQRVFGFLKRRQARFPNKALFLVVKFWIPRPPLCLGLCTSDQLSKWIFFLCSVVPRRKFLWYHSFLG